MAEEAGGYVRIEVDALVTELENMMSVNLSMSSRCSIFRVPNILLRHNPNAYLPKAFSIGPFHYNNSHLEATQKYKLKYLLGLISRFPNSNPETKLRALTEAIVEIQVQAREFYEGLNDMTTDEFVKILVLDGCFLIELFRKVNFANLREEDDPIFTTSYMFEFLHHDLILLENQIPWPVLHRLFEMTRTSEDSLPLNMLVTDFFYVIFSRSITLFDKLAVRSYLYGEHANTYHILDLLRNSMVLSSSIVTGYWEKFSQIKWQQMPSATSLWQSGIKFKKATSSASILDIQFKDGVLEIPQIQIHEMTESLFRNLICLEQCLPNCEGVITSYAILLDHLINTSKDMELLCEYEVINNFLDIEEATDFLNQLCHDTGVRDFHYAELSEEVNYYCQRPWTKYRRMLKRDYFNYPGAFISITVAAILFILTLLQTLFSIIK